MRTIVRGRWCHSGVAARALEWPEDGTGAGGPQSAATQRLPATALSKPTVPPSGHGELATRSDTLTLPGVQTHDITGVAFISLDELVEHDMLSYAAASFLKAAVKARQSIEFAGPPGSGKTTMLSCCAAELDPELRVVVAEEVFEADVPLPNVASMQTRAGRHDRPEVDLRRLVAGFLRMAPDYAIVGEVRDREALPLLLTLSSGVKGFTTVHAGSARQALTRLRFVCQLSDAAASLPMSALNSLVSEAVDIVVHSARRGGKVQVTEIVAVEELQAGPEAAHFTTTELFARRRWDAPLEWSGHLPSRAAGAFAEADVDLRALLDDGRGHAGRLTSLPRPNGTLAAGGG